MVIEIIVFILYFLTERVLVTFSYLYIISTICITQNSFYD